MTKKKKNKQRYRAINAIDSQRDWRESRKAASSYSFVLRSNLTRIRFKFDDTFSPKRTRTPLVPFLSFSLTIQQLRSILTGNGRRRIGCGEFFSAIFSFPFLLLIPFRAKASVKWMERNQAITERLSNLCNEINTAVGIDDEIAFLFAIRRQPLSERHFSPQNIVAMRFPTFKSTEFSTRVPSRDVYPIRISACPLRDNVATLYHFC